MGLGERLYWIGTIASVFALAALPLGVMVWSAWRDPRAGEHGEVMAGDDPRRFDADVARSQHSNVIVVECIHEPRVEGVVLADRRLPAGCDATAGGRRTDEEVKERT